MDHDDRLTTARRDIQAWRRRPQWGLTQETPFGPSVVAWMEALADADRVVYFLSFSQMESLGLHLAYTDEQWQADLVLAGLAERWSAVGMYLDGPRVGFRSQTYRTFTDFPSAAVGTELPIKSGTAAAEFRRFRLDDLYCRARAAAGRLLCHPQFMAERDHLRTLWRSLPSRIRPVLPLYQRYIPLAMNARLSKSETARWKDFGQQFQDFTTRWRLQSMLTWDLPDPLYFHSRTARVSTGEPDDDSHVTTISGLIALGKNDSRIPHDLNEHHAAWRKRVGLKPMSSRWERAATMAELQFLELALASRINATHSALTKTACEQQFADWTGLDVGNIRKQLRERARLLKRTDLSG